MNSTHRDGTRTRRGRYVSLLVTSMLALGLMTSAAHASGSEPTTSEAETSPTTEAPDPTTTEAPAPTTTEAPVPTTSEAPVPTTSEAPVPTTSEAPVPTTSEVVPPTTGDVDEPDDEEPGDDDGMLGGGDFGIFSIGDGVEERALVTKTAQAPAGGVTPGLQFFYDIEVACTDIRDDCVGFFFEDVIPAELEIVQSQLPQSIPGLRTVSYDEATRTLRVDYLEPTTNPPGFEGLNAGSNDTFEIYVRLPAADPPGDGAIITNTGEVFIPGETGRQFDTADVTVRIPVGVTPTPSKAWSGTSVVAGSGAPSTVTIGATNLFTGDVQIERLTATDDTAATWEHFDLTTPITLDTLDPGLQAEFFVLVGSTWHSAGVQSSAPGTFTLPAAVPDPTQIIGARVEFTPTVGDAIPSGVGGTASFGLELRDTFRSDDEQVIDPTSAITVRNCVTATADVTDDGPEVSDPTCVDKQILPSRITIVTGKTWTATGGPAVVGAESPVTATITARNDSAFPIGQIQIVEPDGDDTDFDLFAVTELVLVFPTGAVSADVAIVYEGGGTLNATYAPGELPGNEVPLTGTPTSITVTYNSAPGESNIAVGATAGINLAGNLTAAATAGELENCVNAIGTNGANTGSDSDCDQLTVEARRPELTGTKAASQSELPAGQPVRFRLTLTNTGNLPLATPVIADPGTSGTDPFAGLDLVSASWFPSTGSGLTPADGTITVQAGGSSYEYDDLPGDPPHDIDSIELQLLPGRFLQPGHSMTLDIYVVRADGVADDAAPIQNCFEASASDQGVGVPVVGARCVTVTPMAEDAAAALAKAISPAELPEWTPGLGRQRATVTLQVANTGNLSASFLEIVDDDADFWNAVDFDGVGAAIELPAGANRVLIEWRDGLGGAWVATNGGVPTTAAAAVWPTTSDDVRGLRFTFTSTDVSTNDGYVLTPCAGGVASGCDGQVQFHVSPRQTLVDAPETPVPASLLNTVGGRYQTNRDDGPADIDEAEAPLALVPGDPELTVAKTAAPTRLNPSQTSLQTLTVTNTGTTWVSGVEVVDLVPLGLYFDDEADVDGDGNPFDVEVDGLPSGDPGPAAGDIAFVPSTDDDGRVDELRWTFGDWQMPPGARIVITFRVGLQLAPGMTAGETLTNRMGATIEESGGGEDAELECAGPTGDEDFGEGIYCVAEAGIIVDTGAAFRARKWVAGDLAIDGVLQWANASGELVAAGPGQGCPALESGGRWYTANPCVALVNRGGEYDYILRVINAGTEPAVRLNLVDNLPVQGDGSLVNAASRGTEWNNRPTLSSGVTITSPVPGGSVSYSDAPYGSWCLDDLRLNTAGCGDDTWGGGGGSGTTAIRFMGDFSEEPLGPGQHIDLRFSMSVPTQIDQLGNELTVAWNSFAHAEETLRTGAPNRVLSPIEPIRVGVSPLRVPTVSVGDYVWVDTNRNGVQDEPAANGINGVRLTLWQVVGGVETPVTQDVHGNPIGETVTADDDSGNPGYYSFDELPILPAGGFYRVRVDPASPPLAPYVPTIANPAVGRGTDSSTWVSDAEELPNDGDRDPTLDFGFVLPKVRVGDYVWVDTDRDGVQDPGEPGIPGVRLTLKRVAADGTEHDVTDVFGAAVGAVFTDGDGYYEFPDLPVLPGGEAYKVYIDPTSPPLAPYIPTVARQGGDRGNDSDTGSATSWLPLSEDGQEDMTLDFGFVLPKVRVGNYVWLDSNRNGRQDPGEPGIPNVTLRITGPGGTPVTDVFGNPVGPTRTDVNGYYVFDNLPVLPPGQSYTVWVTPPFGYNSTAPGVGDRGGDSSSEFAVSGDLTNDGDEDMTLDFGFVLIEDEVAAILPATS